MFTLGFFYFLSYIILVLSLFILTFFKFPQIMLTEWSISNFLVFLGKYTNLKNIFFFLIFLLTGLPPVGLFFIKFNILTFLFYQIHIGLIILLFFIFFLNMLYYLQIFNTKNIKKNIYSQMQPSILSMWKNSTYQQLSFSSIRVYFNLLFVINVSIFMSLAVFFFSDFFIILSL